MPKYTEQDIKAIANIVEQCDRRENDPRISPTQRQAASERISRHSEQLWNDQLDR